jgi:hypothetical protein
MADTRTVTLPAEQMAKAIDLLDQVTCKEARIMATDNRTPDLINDPRCRGKVTSIRERQFWKLETEKHGRLFAIDLLSRMHQRWRRTYDDDGEPSSDYSAITQEPDVGEPGEMCVYRTGPQSDLLLRAYDELTKRGTREAVLGFHVVMTDFIGSAVADASPDYDYYADAESEGKLETWGSVRALANG